MRVVLDTNVYISAILFGGMAEKVLERLSQQGSLIFISPLILGEVARVLQEKFGLPLKTFRGIKIVSPGEFLKDY